MTLSMLELRSARLVERILRLEPGFSTFQVAWLSASRGMQERVQSGCWSSDL